MPDTPIRDTDPYGPLAEKLARIEAVYAQVQPIERYRVLDQRCVWITVSVLTLIGLIWLIAAAVVNS